MIYNTIMEELPEKFICIHYGFKNVILVRFMDHSINWYRSLTNKGILKAYKGVLTLTNDNPATLSFKTTLYGDTYLRYRRP